MAALKTMKMSQLLALRADVERMLLAKRGELLAQLGEIDALALRSFSSAPAGRQKGVRGNVAAKYRHPRTGETWSGRGMMIGWLAAELKNGKKAEDFLIASSPKRQLKKGRNLGKAARGQKRKRLVRKGVR